jgi:hypothetical protein
MFGGEVLTLPHFPSFNSSMSSPHDDNDNDGDNDNDNDNFIDYAGPV